MDSNIGVLVDIESRLRMITRKYDSLNAKINAANAEIDSVAMNRKASIETLRQDIAELKNSLRSIENLTISIILKLRGAAKKDDLEKFLVLARTWQPENWITVKSFRKHVIDELTLQEADQQAL